MNISDKFSTFCSSLRMSDNTVSNIRTRYHSITKRLNKDFRSIDNDYFNSLYVGFYGKSTAIHVSDIDMLYILPWEYYTKYNSYIGNGQSALLQAVNDSIKQTYPVTYISGDGQVVKVCFFGDVEFKVVPCFEYSDCGFCYPDTHNGGSWKTTNPRQEINTINTWNSITNKNLKRLCRMVRAWKYNCNVPIGGLIIYTFAYRFLEDWKYNNWNVRESYLSIITDLKMDDTNIETIHKKRDKLQERLASIYKGSSRTISKAYKEATKALKLNEEMTFSDEEIDCFLPVELRKTKE